MFFKKENKSHSETTSVPSASVLAKDIPVFSLEDVWFYRISINVMFWAGIECIELYPKGKGHLYIPDTFSFPCMYFNFWLFIDDEVFSLSL